MCGSMPCQKTNCTWSERFRHEAEAREVMRLDKERRLGYYQTVKAKRGEAAAKALRDEVTRQWKLANAL